MRATAVLTSLLVVAVLGLAACGDAEERNDYVAALNRAQSAFQQRFDRLGSQLTPTSTRAQDQRTLREYREAIATARRDLGAIEPPEDVAGLHARILRAIDRYGVAVDRARKDFLARDPQAVLAANARLRRDVEDAGRDLSTTIDELNRKLQE